MIRATIAGLIGFIFVLFEGWLIIKLMNYSGIDFGGIQMFAIYWLINTAIVYTAFLQFEQSFKRHVTK